jgi:ABC-type nitrate/sulfonate/bicarbonate transport system substrate-binding protein
VSATLAISVVVIIAVAAVGGVYYLNSAGLLFPKAPPQTFRFASQHLDATHAVTQDALNHLNDYNLHAIVSDIGDATALTSATANGQIDIMVFQFPVPTLNAIEKGANLVAIGEESTSFLQDLVVGSDITTFKQLNGTTMAAFELDGPVLFPPVFASYGENFSNYKINLVVIGDSSVKAQALIAGKYVGAFLDPQDAAKVFNAAPGKFHVLGTSALALPGIGGGVYFANKDWLKAHNDQAVSFIESVLKSARSAHSNLAAWIQTTWNANYTGLDFKIYNSTQVLLNNADYFSPNMVTYTPNLMNASDYYMFYGQLLTSPGNVSQIYNFSVVKAALDSVGRVTEPTGPYQDLHPLSISLLSGLSIPGLLLLAAPAILSTVRRKQDPHREK